MLKHKNEKRDGFFKIYIEGYEPQRVTKQILNKLDEHYKFSKNYVQLYSSSGIFNVVDNKIYKQIPNDKPISHYNFNENVNLILDGSFFEEEIILSQIPMHNHYKKVTQFNFCLGDDSKLYFILEGYYGDATSDKHLKTGLKKYAGFVPDNFYFLAKEEIDNYLIKKELNGFLLMLI